MKMKAATLMLTTPAHCATEGNDFAGSPTEEVTDD
jgi:hypothetical protein